MTYDVTITADGACEPNPGFGGWACVIRGAGLVECSLSGWNPQTTNNRMELQAIIAGVRHITKPSRILVRSDSMLAIAWCRPGYFEKHRKRAQKLPEVVQMVCEYHRLAQPHKVDFLWIKGHAGDYDNERCDQLAVAQASRLGPYEYRKAGYVFHDPILDAPRIALATSSEQSLLSL